MLPYGRHMLGRTGHRDDQRPPPRPRATEAGRWSARPLALQRQIGNRAFAAVVARQPPPTYSGSVFKRIVGTIDAEGRYTRVDDKGAPLAGAAGGNVRDLGGQVTQNGGKTPGRSTATTGSGSFSLWDAEGTSTSPS